MGLSFVGCMCNGKQAGKGAGDVYLDDGKSQKNVLNGEERRGEEEGRRGEEENEYEEMEVNTKNRQSG